MSLFKICDQDALLLEINSKLAKVFLNIQQYCETSIRALRSEYSGIGTIC